MSNHAAHVAALAYEVRNGAGMTLAFHFDRDAAEEERDLTGGTSYVTFVELIDGVWTAQED